ncbi:basic blue protein [Setaria viridis]|uniref:basic blue protein n=1 Tax=Setaria viridis TaxID=4556 RepID=UPI0014936222|nr:basic blue protein-like [Setaria viridis]
MASPKTTLLVAAAVAAVVGVAALLPETACAATYRVGDDAGWNTAVDYDAWASGKKFKVGDTLVFRYDTPSEKDVVVVDAQGYAECSVPDNARLLNSGDDHVVLEQAGQFFFICDAEGECDSGMKLAVNVH